MNQKTRQRATLSVEKDICMLLNNSNLRIDCRNNIDNCFSEPLYDDISEIVLPISFEGGNNSDISVENIFIEQRRAQVRG